jgi:hypothetical protein
MAEVVQAVDSGQREGVAQFVASVGYVGSACGWLRAICTVAALLQAATYACGCSAVASCTPVSLGAMRILCQLAPAHTWYLGWAFMSWACVHLLSKTVHPSILAGVWLAS